MPIKYVNISRSLIENCWVKTVTKLFNMEVSVPVIIISSTYLKKIEHGQKHLKQIERHRHVNS